MVTIIWNHENLEVKVRISVSNFRITFLWNVIKYNSLKKWSILRCLCLITFYSTLYFHYNVEALDFFTQYIWLIAIVSSYFAESDFLSLHLEWECRLCGLTKKQTFESVYLSFFFRWWVPQISEWDTDRPRKTAFCWVFHTWHGRPPHPFPTITSTSHFSVAQLSSLDFNLGTWPSQIANANKELPAAVPLDSRRRRLSLFFASAFTATGTEQDREGTRQELGGPNEEWGSWISTGQKGLGVEPVLCTGGVHGVRSTVRGQGKRPHFFSFLWCARSHKSHSKELGRNWIGGKWREQ